MAKQGKIFDTPTLEGATYNRKTGIIESGATPTNEDFELLKNFLTELLSTELSEENMEPILRRYETVKPRIGKYLQDIFDVVRFSKLAAELDELEPYLLPELIKLNPDLAKADPEDGATLFDYFLDQYAPGELLDESLDPETDFSKALDAARNAQKRDIAAGNAASITYKRTEDDYLYLTDKLAREFFSVNAKPGTLKRDIAAGQLSFDLFHEHENSIALKYEGIREDPVTLYYNYGELQNFDAYDFFVASALDALYSRGDNLVSISKIWHEMGGKGSPNTEQLSELENSLLKGMTTPFVLDDKEVMRARGKDKYHQRVTHVFEISYLSERRIANGKPTDAWIRINGLTLFHETAKALDHIATWNRNVLINYTGKRTTRYYRVLNFLLSQISWMRHTRSTRKNTVIMYSSLYEKTGAKTSRDKQLTRDMFFRLLDEIFIPLGYVISYTEQGKTNPGIKLKLAKDNTSTTKRITAKRQN